MGLVPKQGAIIPHFVQPDPNHPPKKSQSGAISGSVRIRDSGVGCPDHHFRHKRIRNSLKNSPIVSFFTPLNVITN